MIMGRLHRTGDVLTMFSVHSLWPYRAPDGPAPDIDAFSLHGCPGLAEGGKP